MKHTATIAYKLTYPWKLTWLNGPHSWKLSVWDQLNEEMAEDIGHLSPEGRTIFRDQLEKIINRLKGEKSKPMKTIVASRWLEGAYQFRRHGYLWPTVAQMPINAFAQLSMQVSYDLGSWDTTSELIDETHSPHR